MPQNTNGRLSVQKLPFIPSIFGQKEWQTKIYRLGNTTTKTLLFNPQQKSQNGITIKSVSQSDYYGHH